VQIIWQWGIDVIGAVQRIHGPTLDIFFKGITALGDKEFFLVFLPMVFWCVDLAVGTRLAVVFLVSSYANVALKEIFQHPRPFHLDPAVGLHEAEGYGFPSGHAQSAVVLWGSLAAEVRKRWLWVLALMLMALIGFSRVFLGVHFPTDVMVGWLVGGLLLVISRPLLRWAEPRLLDMGLSLKIALGILFPVVLVLLLPVGDSPAAMGVLVGAGVGLPILHHVTAFRAGGSTWERVLRFVVGAAVLGALYIGLKALFPEEGEWLYEGFRFVRYAVLGLWTCLGAPWLFVKLGLARA